MPLQLETWVEGNQIVTRAYCLSPHTVGSVAKDSTKLTVRDTTGLSSGNPVLVEDAGHEGGHLLTTISSISGNVVTLAAAAAETVRRVRVGKLTDPGSVTFTARNADGTPTAYTSGSGSVTNPAVGIWELRLTHDQGEWQIHFAGTAPCLGAAETGYRVSPARAKA